MVPDATDLTASFLQFLTDPQSFLQGLGGFALVAVLLIVFAECGLLIGFFLPGDSLLFVTGLLVAQGFISVQIWLVCVLLVLAAVAGNLVGYWIGYRAGPALFQRQDSKIFKPEYVTKTHAFFEKYGTRAIVLARFVPIVRTFITAMAGTGRMDFRAYAIFSAIGGTLWAAGVTLLGYFLGNITFIKENIEFILILVVVASVVPIGVEYLRHRRQSRSSASSVS